jgi:Flp pilus assembly protein TadD
MRIANGRIAAACVTIVLWLNLIPMTGAAATPDQSPGPMAQQSQLAELHRRAQEQYRQGNFKAAIVALNQVILLNPKDATAYNRRGLARADLGDRSGAIQDFNQAIALNPNYIDAYSNRGLIRAESGDHRAAIRDYDRAIQLNDQVAQVYSNRGIARSKSPIGKARSAISIAPSPSTRTTQMLISTED